MGKLASTESQSTKLAVVLLGASGDLAKRKIYPSLFKLYRDSQIDQGETVIWGFGRSNLTHNELRCKLSPYLRKQQNEEENSCIDRFLSICFYQQGSGYDDLNAFRHIQAHLIRSSISGNGLGKHHLDQCNFNKLFYFAIPPNLFLPAASAIHKVFFDIDPKSHSHPQRSWSRVLFEKPFGRDLQSYFSLSSGLSQIFRESEMYRIDHYLGKRIVRWIQRLRFNETLGGQKDVWNGRFISHVVILLKEPFGTDGRGGYFDRYGIIRDVIQNHLLQILTLVAMEDPKGVGQGEAGIVDEDEKVRSSKVTVLSSIQPPSYPEDCVLGQYEGYADDPSIRNKGTTTPTFAAIRLRVNTTRWQGVPFYLIAGKAMDERSAEVQIAFRDDTMNSDVTNTVTKRDLVMNIQPDQCIYMTRSKANRFMYSKKETSSTKNLLHMWQEEDDAYKCLIKDSLLGVKSSFVRDDELQKSWEILTPLLQQTENVAPLVYEKGSSGPNEVRKMFPELSRLYKSHIPHSKL